MENKQFRIPVYAMMLLLACTAYTAGAMTISVSDAGGDHGTTIDVPINVSTTASENIGATDISLTYDPDVITATGVTNGTLIADTDLIATYTATSGIVNISVASLYGISGVGSIAIVQFYVEGSANATCPLTLSRAEAYDLDKPIMEDGNVTGYEAMSVTSENGLFTVGAGAVSPQTGDIDGSGGDPTMSDAVYLAKHVVGLSGYETICADGDIDGSGGDPTMSDAVYLAKHVVGLSGYETIYSC
ncbi:MAG: cohesin domain-containing protein [Euryarchaeota archaeon]|nr:cohesin domain-containing protein [Euryarchaeota archaeon]